jgi:hypothetical protein
MSPDEKKKLYEAIGYAGDDTSTSTYPEEVCFFISQQTKTICLILVFFSISISI